MEALTLDCRSLELTDEQFYQLCINNEDLRIERNADGDLLIMPPTGGETGNRHGRLIQQLFNWSDRDATGIAFDSSTGFKLPNGANRSPDASWIPLTKWDGLTSDEKQRFIPLCPDFVIELLSPSDNLSKTQAKLQEYIDNGTKLGWLINRSQKQVEIYRQGQVDVLNLPDDLSGEDVLKGFTLDLQPIW